MNNIGTYLVEELIKEIENITDYVVVYSGRFQPFHKGHFATYQNLVKKFGKGNVYIGTSDKTDKLKSPFNFKEKQTIMTKMFGIPANRIVEIKNPYVPTEILKKFDKDTTAFVTVVGEKDEQRLGGKYFTPYKGVFDAGYGDKGYVYISPAQPNAISGTDVRNWLGKGEIEDRKKLFSKAYPKFDEKIFQLITSKLSSLNDGRVPYQVDKWKKVPARSLKKAQPRYYDLGKIKEEIFIPKEFIQEWIDINLNHILSEISTSTAGAATNVGKIVDDGPNLFFKEYDTFDAISKRRAEQIGYTVFSQIMSGEYEDYTEYPIYPNGPVKAVTPFPAGVIGKTTATNQKDLFGDDAYEKWYNHVTRSMALVGYQLVKDFNKSSKDLAIQSADNIKKVAGIEKIKDTVMESGMGLAMGYPSKEQLIQKKKERDKLRAQMDRESEYYEPIEEDITIPLNVGDTVLGGKFKNKKIVVKDIGKNEKGEVTVNGKPLLKYRLIDEIYAEIIDELRKDPQFEELLSEIPMDDLQQLDKFADKQMSPIDIVLSGRHFLDRLVDKRNVKPISVAELTGFFKRLARKKTEFVEFLKKYGEIVAKDNRTKINIPFMQQANKAIAKTIMRKDNFKTPSPELKFEATSRGKMYEPKRIKAYYEALCKSEGVKSLPIKFGSVGKGGAALTFNPKTMKPLYISFNVNRLSDPEFAIIHELTHQIKLETEGDAYVGKRDQLAKFKKLENYLIDKYVYSNYSKLLYENKNKEEWAIFRLNSGKKWFATGYSTTTRQPDEYRADVKYSSPTVLKFTHDRAIRIIQTVIGISEEYGIVNSKGIQKKFDWRVKYPKKYDDIALLINEDTVKYISKSLGVPRSKMPQINSKDIGDFVKYVKDKGISVSPSIINVSKVGMTQKDINVDKVKDLLGVEKSNLAKPVIISKDNYILDGHHRVAALYNVDNNFKLKTIKVDIGIKDLLKLAKEYPNTTFKSITEGSNIGTLGGGNNSARWTPSGKKKELGVEQLSGYIQKDFPVADSVDISGEKDSWVGTSKTAKYHNKVKAKRDGSGNLVFENIESNLEKKYGVEADIYEYTDYIELSKVVVPKESRGSGIGTKFMNDLINYAKAKNKDIFLTPSSDFGGSKGRLIQFYKGFGFKNNKGKYRDFRSKNSMVLHIDVE